MNVSIGRAQRYALFVLSAAGYTAALTGIDVPGEAQTATATAFDRSPLAKPATPRDPARAVLRDPFAAAPDAEASAPADTVSPAETLGASNAPAVPDIDVADAREAEESSAVPAPALALRATIVGTVSVAYVSDGTDMQIVRTGDRLGTLRVARIGLTSLTFDDGSRLSLENAPSHDTPAVRPVTRRLAKHTARATPLPASSPVPSVSPASAIGVTPNPLRTVDRTGLAPGVNPTPDLTDPTPLPYQYPYPPARR